MQTFSNKKICEAILQRCRRKRWYCPEDEQDIVSVKRDECRISFLFPPLSEKELRAAERRMGISLPPLLNDMYMTLANGGFSPDYGIGGLGKKGYAMEDHTVDQEYRSRCTDRWKKYLVPITSRGCAIFVCVDCTPEKGFPVYEYDPNKSTSRSWDYKTCLKKISPSFNVWVMQWLNTKK